VPAGAGYGPALLPDGQPDYFQNGIPAPVAPPVPANGILPGTPTQGYKVITRNYKNPYVETWNIAVQQSLPLHLTLEAAYVGNHGVDIGASANLNAGMVIGAGTFGQPEYPRTAATTMYFQGVSTSYNALQAKLDRRFGSGLMLTTAFTWGKALTHQSDDDGGLLFYIDSRRNWARADFDRTFGFVQSYVYRLPVGLGERWLTSGLASRILGGWALSGIMTLQSGIPITFTANGGPLAAPGNTQTPNLVAPIQILHGINGNPWLSVSSFAQPVGAVFGNLGRNVISGPGYFELDLSLAKNIRIREKYNIEVRAETFNFTNTPQFANPSASITSQTFGAVTSTIGSGTGVNGLGGGRVVQLGTRITF
jgi:hypothetical protein